MTFANDCANCCFFRAKLMCKERKILRFVPQKLYKSLANGNPSSRRKYEIILLTYFVLVILLLDIERLE